MEKKKFSKSDFWQRVAAVYNASNGRPIGPGYASNIYSGSHPSASAEVTRRVEHAVRVVKKEMKSEGYDFSII